jgi:hypothetical protein
MHNNLLPLKEKKNIKLIPIDPTVSFATTTLIKNSHETTTNANGYTYIPLIDIDGKKYFPVYLNQSINEAQIQSIPSKPNICLKPLSVPTKDDQDQPQISNK